MKYAQIELHAHTIHSDGQFSPQELIERTVSEGYDALVITDHNTLSALPEAQDKAQTFPLVLIPGMEWTTFYGHMLVIGAEDNIDWREAKIDTIDEEISQIKEAKGIVGIAHPFALGSPICTGCRWLFKVNQWDQIDFIELWNSHSPQHMIASERAYLMWKKLIEKGYRIACSAGRDWHRPEPEGSYIGKTMIAYQHDLNQATIMQSLRSGRSYITLQPHLHWEVSQDGNIYTIGDTCYQKSLNMTIEIDNYSSMILDRYIIYNNETIIFEEQIIDRNVLTLEMTPQSGFIRLEIYGWIDQKSTRVIITNPIFVQ